MQSPFKIQYVLITKKERRIFDLRRPCLSLSGFIIGFFCRRFNIIKPIVFCALAHDEELKIHTAPFVLCTTIIPVIYKISCIIKATLNLTLISRSDRLNPVISSILLIFLLIVLRCTNSSSAVSFTLPL